ncbi:hypothetical protein HPB47_017474, partial [Ixodes persulcatus]
PAVCRVVHRVGLAVLTHGPNFVSWPTEKEALHIISRFEAKAGFPGVLGAIDGSHIVCKGLQCKNAQSYINQHGLPSVLLQPICDPEARRFELPTMLTADKFPFDGHLLGDGAYPLRQSLLVPYRNNGRLTEQHRKYNTKHATTRVAIERAFRILKGRFGPSWKARFVTCGFSFASKDRRSQAKPGAKPESAAMPPPHSPDVAQMLPVLLRNDTRRLLNTRW